MGNAQTCANRPPESVANTGDASIVGDLRPSADPAVVLSSLARACVPKFSDGCAVHVIAGLEPTFRMSYPTSDDDSARDGPADSALGGHVVSTPFEIPSNAGHPCCAGMVLHHWKAGIPTRREAVIAGLLVEQAIQVIRYERLTETTDDAEARAVQLAHTTITAETMGVATGIVMATHRLSQADAVDLLKAASRHRQRTVHLVALEVIAAGELSHLAPRSVQRAPATVRALRPLS